ncbi:glycerol-3-phosphate dehydrogenase subunit GlpB [Halovenus halobia]|uniref:glycerol-3-phosphate dehydrogenase subunit GlpB n=1 Tax=Halovenus halobia TaxID=3396622 RepID=UPI003F5485D4
MSDDVLVVGGGIEGYAAALSALETDSAASVRLLRQRSDRFQTETGLVDLLGYEPDEDGPVDRPLAAIERLQEDHPYSRLGLDTVSAALELFDTATGDQYSGAETETNALLPTAVGRLTPAVRYPESAAAGVASGADSMRLVGFESIPDFDAELAANRLNNETPLSVTGRTVRAPLPADLDRTEIPEILDQNRSVDGQPIRAALAEKLQPTLDVEPRVGLPAVLGQTEAPAIRTALEEALHVSVFEVPLGPPSLPGQRLESLLSAAVRSRGGTIEESVVSDVEEDDSRITSVTADGQQYDADSYVLATGGVEAGGVVTDSAGVGEPVFGCPASLPGDRLVGREFLSDHPAVRAGVEVDDRRRPLEGGSAVAENLYGAGRVLASPNVVAEGSVGGFALVTGYAAGQRALEQS